MFAAPTTGRARALRLVGIAWVGGVVTSACVFVKIDPGESLTDVSLTDVSLSDSLSEGFTQTSIVPTEPTTGDDPACGDGVVDPGEACDDGNASNNDGCLNTCELADCGDGFVWFGVEACDDGNPSNSDACLNTCELASCGDGFVHFGVEACDDGNNVGGDGCEADCSLPSCGDGVVQAGEDCDDGNQSNTDACLNTCELASCGDGFVHAGVEECDDGNDDPSDGCHGCLLTDDLPPECIDIMLLQQSSRHVSSQGVVECDLDVPEGGVWTRFTGAAGTTMPTTPPPAFACGTHAPGWLNGSIPGVADGVVSREVCFHWEDQPCHWTVPIQVRNCGPFVMFELQPVPTCALRYCGSG